jgi:predicted Zn-dependent protease
MRLKKYFTFSIPTLVILLFASSCVVQESAITGSKRAYAYSWDQEVQIGGEVDQEIVAQFGIYQDEALDSYYQAMSMEILANSHMRGEDTAARFRNTEFTFRILDSPVINAFALPGGYVYVTRGLMAHMNNEAQLAVVIGHEIGHVAARHASQRGLQQMIGQVAVIGGAILGQELLGLPGETILNISGQAAQLLFLRHSREHERESDRLGVEYAAKTGYAAEEGAAFFTSLRRLSEQSGQAIPNFLSTHPDPGEREREIPRLAENWRAQGYDQQIRNDEKYMSMINGLIYGENPRNGFAEGGVYYHPEFEFSMSVPSEWHLINQPTQVVMVSKAEDAVIIMRLDQESANARESVQNFLTANDVTTSDQGSASNAGGFPAYQANFEVADGDNELGVNIYALEYGNQIFRFINYTDKRQFDKYITDFSATTNSFNQLRDSRILNIRPVTLSIVKTDRRAEFRNLLPSSLPMSITAEELAILNQVYLDEVIEVGTLIKIPVQ